MISNIIFTMVLLPLTVFFALVVFRIHAFKHLKAWTVIAFAFLVGGIFLLGVISKQEITKKEDEISVLVRLLHSEIDNIESISASNKKTEYIKQSDIVLSKIDSIALRIKEEEAYTDINIDKRIAKIREIVNESKYLVETLNDTIYIRDLVIDNQYEVTGIGKTNLIAKNNAISAAQKTCTKKTAPVVVDEKTAYQGVLKGVVDDETGKLVEAAAGVIGAVTGRNTSLAKDDDYQTTLTFYCKANA